MPASLDIVIVGTGIGGLTAASALAGKGHRVTVLEATAKLQAIGGNIVMAANACRVLDQLGLYDAVLGICAEQPMVRFHRRFTGEKIAELPAAHSEKLYGYPMWAIHRADFQEVLYKAAIERGVQVRLGCPVVSVDEKGPSVTLKSGEVVHGDIVIGADGAKSVVREAINTPSERGIMDTGVDVTRFNIPRTTMNSDSRTASMTRELSLWHGFNTGLANTSIMHHGEWWSAFDVLHERCPSSAPGLGKPQNLDDLKKYFRLWGPSVQHLFSYIKEAHVWQIIESRSSKWVSTSGRVVLLGDSCHAVLPHSGQGGGMAVEDAGTLAECLSRAQSLDDVPQLLRTYEEIRRPRCKMIQDLGRAMKETMFLPDGPEQQARDYRYANYKAWQFNEPWDGKHIDDLPESIRAPNYMAWACGHDAILYANRRLDQMSGAATADAVDAVTNGHGH